MSVSSSNNQQNNAFDQYQKDRISHWDQVAEKLSGWQGLGGYYHRRLNQVIQFFVPAGKRVLEIGCGAGDLLAHLKPDYGLGVDFSEKMIVEARTRHPELNFLQADAHALELDETFDFIILSDSVNEFWDVQAVFEKLADLSTPSTRVILNYYSRLWELPLKIARALKLATPTLYQNWLTQDDVENLLYLSGFEIIRNQEEILFPLDVPLLTPLLNRYLVKLWPFNELALTHVTLARPIQKTVKEVKQVVSVIVPARNESGNIDSIFERVPEMGAGTELIFVEGHSQDDTYQTIEKAIRAHPEHKAQLFQQSGKGKGDAVRLGFSEASGDVLMILDADLTVPPEDLPRFYEALHSGKGDFINGVRLIYPMEKDAMRFFNFLGNKFFSLVFTWLLGQPIKDTLCGTKVLTRANYQAIASNRAYFGDFDPFGDFDLLFGAAKLNLKIVDLPIRYRERVYGETNIQRWKHGWLLLKMVAFAARRLKFT